MDPKLMTFLSSFVGKEILARNYPYMQYHNVVDETSSKLRYEKKITKAEGPDVWHIDTPLLNKSTCFIRRFVGGRFLYALSAWI